MTPKARTLFTVGDDTLSRHIHTAGGSESLRIAPSAAAAFDGPRWRTASEAGIAYPRRHGLSEHLQRATHIIWTTGGVFVRDDEYRSFMERGANQMLRHE